MWMRPKIWTSPNRIWIRPKMGAYLAKLYGRASIVLFAISLMVIFSASLRRRQEFFEAAPPVAAPEERGPVIITLTPIE